MKKTVLVIALFFLIANLALAAQMSVPKTITVKGIIIDNMCAIENKNNLSNFIETHDKDCALMSHCAASGFSLYRDGRLMEFDKESNSRILKFIKTTDSSMNVEVTVKRSGKKWNLLRIIKRP